MKQFDTYKDPISYTLGNAEITINVPILSEQERIRRMKRIHDTAAALLREVEDIKQVHRVAM